MLHPRQRYEELVARVRDEALLGSIAATLEWDEEACMPEAGAENRARQQALLAGLTHERATDPRRGELLAELAAAELPPDAACNVRELRLAYDRDRRLPRRLVESLAETCARATVGWAEARRARDFARFAPHLERVVALKRDEGACLGDGGDVYDALLDDHEAGLTWAELDGLFAELEPGIARLLDRARGAAPPAGHLRGDFPLEAQRALAAWLAGTVGFDLEAGRIGTAVHPFTIGLGPGDCRIAARWDPSDLSRGLLVVLHELGHGLYEQGLDADEWGMPCGLASSDAVDESQARLYEIGVGKSPAFWRFLWPELVRRFPALAGRDRDDCARSLSKLEPGCLRATADDLTYHLHIVIRCELERALLGGDLGIADLPAAWDAAYAARLGVTAPDVVDGCLQDGHWADGMFGYFPCYTLGDLYASALLDGATRDLGDVAAQWAAGELAPTRAWLRRNVHSVGNRLPARAMITAAAGRVPSPHHLLDRLSARVAWAYDL